MRRKPRKRLLRGAIRNFLDRCMSETLWAVYSSNASIAPCEKWTWVGLTHGRITTILFQ